jgi:hypothetical protein
VVGRHGGGERNEANEEGRTWKGKWTNGRSGICGTGTDVTKVRALQDDLYEYHAATAPSFPLTPSHPSPPSFLDLLHAYSLVSSRAFQVDGYHRTALVPLADLFNHQEANHVAFEVSIQNLPL